MMFGSDFSSQSVAAEDHVGFDLCVLGTSHHTVITYGKRRPEAVRSHKCSSSGTFGIWGALLAGGDVIAARGRNVTLAEEDQIYVRAGLEGWLYLDTSHALVRLLEVDTDNHTFILAH